MATIPKTKVECPIALIWPITEQRLKDMKDKPGKYLHTDSFLTAVIPGAPGGVQYYLALCPNQEDAERRGQTWIYLYLSFSDEIKIEANYTIAMESVKCSKRFYYVFEKSVGRGCKFCTSEELFDPTKGYLVNGKLTIKMEGVLSVEKEMPVKTEPTSDRTDVLCLGLWNQDNKDFAVVAGGKKIMAHKIVLAAQSRVFGRMFESGMKETQENKVTIEDFTFGIVEMAIKLCYHHSLVSHQTTLYEKMKLLQFFDKYEIEALKDTFESYLMSEINESTVCSIANASLLSNSVKLVEKCAEFLRDCLKNTKPIKGFDSLDEDFALAQFKNAFYNVSK